MGTVNVGSMTKRSGEVVEKRLWKGCEEGISSVGIFVAERWI